MLGDILPFPISTVTILAIEILDDDIRVMKTPMFSVLQHAISGSKPSTTEITLFVVWVPLIGWICVEVCLEDIKRIIIYIAPMEGIGTLKFSVKPLMIVKPCLCGKWNFTYFALPLGFFCMNSIVVSELGLALK